MGRLCIIVRLRKDSSHDSAGTEHEARMDMRGDEFIDGLDMFVLDESQQ